MRRAARAALAIVLSVLPFAPSVPIGCSSGDAVRAPETKVTPSTPIGSTTDASTLIDTAVDDAPADPVWFDDVSDKSGLSTFVRTKSEWTSLTGRMQGGVCVFDADGDGHLDLFFAAHDSAGGSRLFMARPLPGQKLHYVDESKARGVDKTGTTLGCLSVDIDGDGDVDLLTTGVGGARLFRNDGSSFVDVTERLPKPADPKGIMMAAVAFDADDDGDLDFAIAGYGHYEAPPPGSPCVGSCVLEPLQYKDGNTALYLQRADGTFEDASDRLVAPLSGPGLVLLATDLDEDGKIDLFLGNDLPSNYDRYFRNLGGGTFSEIGMSLGVAYSAKPSGVSSMSANDPDFDLDGHLDLLESSWEGESDALYKCSGSPAAKSCTDVAEAMELWRTPSNLRWGQAMVDFDDDGIPELFEAVGHYYLNDDEAIPITVGPPDVAPILWHRPNTFAPYALVEPLSGLASTTGGRGVIAADLDGDGDLDVVVASALGHPLLLENVHKRRGHSLAVRLAGKGKNRAGIGARVTVRASGVGVAWPALVHAGHGYLSSSNDALHFGLGAAIKADVDVAWVNGKTSHLASVEADATITVTEP